MKKGTDLNLSPSVPAEEKGTDLNLSPVGIEANMTGFWHSPE